MTSKVFKLVFPFFGDSSQETSMFNNDNKSQHLLQIENARLLKENIELKSSKHQLQSDMDCIAMENRKLKGIQKSKGKFNSDLKTTLAIRHDSFIQDDLSLQSQVDKLTRLLELAESKISDLNTINIDLQLLHANNDAYMVDKLSNLDKLNQDLNSKLKYEHIQNRRFLLQYREDYINDKLDMNEILESVQ